VGEQPDRRCAEEDRRAVFEDLNGERRRTRIFFNLVAPAFRVVDRRLLPEYRRALAEVDLDPSSAVLDLGTGTGTLARAFVERGHPVTGVDFAERLLRRAARHVPAARLETMDLVNLPSLADDAFDIIAMGYLLHGLAPSMRRFVLCEAARIAASRVVVFDYARPGPLVVRLVEWVEGPHYSSFVSRPFVEHAREAGLHTIRSGATSDVGGWWLCARPPGAPLARFAGRA
jgi:SAM-dependent methyltransferase